MAPEAEKELCRGDELLKFGRTLIPDCSLLCFHAPSNRSGQTSEEWCGQPRCSPGSPRLSPAIGVRRKSQWLSFPNAPNCCPTLYRTPQSRWLRAGRHSAGISDHWTLLPRDRTCTPARQICRCRNLRNGCAFLPGRQRRAPPRGAWTDVCEASGAQAERNQSPLRSPEGPGSSPSAHAYVWPSPSAPEVSWQAHGHLWCCWQRGGSGSPPSASAPPSHNPSHRAHSERRWGRGAWTRGRRCSRWRSSQLWRRGNPAGSRYLECWSVHRLRRSASSDVWVSASSSPERGRGDPHLLQARPRPPHPRWWACGSHQRIASQRPACQSAAPVASPALSSGSSWSYSEWWGPAQPGRWIWSGRGASAGEGAALERERTGAGEAARETAPEGGGPGAGESGGRSPRGSSWWWENTADKGMRKSAFLNMTQTHNNHRNVDCFTAHYCL